MISVPPPLPRKPEPEHKYLVMLLGLVCWEKPTLSYKSPPRIKTGVKITSQSLAGRLATFIGIFFVVVKKDNVKKAPITVLGLE